MNSMQAALPVPAVRSPQWRSLELILGTLLTGAMLALVLLSVWLFPDRGSLMDLAARLTQPFTYWAHSLGTDPLGRGVLVGGRISLLVGFTSVLGASVLGIAVGLVAGYYRGFWDMLLMRCVDVQLALPFILVALTFISIPVSYTHLRAHETGRN